MLYNQYRPSHFKEVCGQEDTLITLRKQVQSGNFGQSYMLAGHHGTGKTSIARILAKAAICLHPTEDGPCDSCANCIAAKTSLDIIELDAASNNGVADIKELINQTKYQPVQMPKKVFIIDEVHNLSTAAFDALLKTLEEPPSYCIFILCTTELHKIPVTIFSRCELYTFKTIDAMQIKERLAFVIQDQNATCEPDALNLIARHSNGALRDALSILEQLLVSTDKNITTSATEKRLGIMDTDIIFKILTALIEFQTADAIDSLDLLLSKGKSPSLIIESTLSVITDIITLKATQNSQSLLHSEEYISSAQLLEKRISFEKLFWLTEQYSNLRTSIRGSINSSMDIRLSLIKMSNVKLIAFEPIAMADTISQLQERIITLENTVHNLTNTHRPTDFKIISDTQIQPDKETPSTYIQEEEANITPISSEEHISSTENIPNEESQSQEFIEKLAVKPVEASYQSDLTNSDERGGMQKNSKEDETSAVTKKSPGYMSFSDLFKRLA